MRLFLPFTTAILLTAVAAISFARGAEVAADGIAVTAAWARATPPGGKVGAAYLTVENRSAAEARLVAATSPAATSVSIHETIEEDGVAKMRPIPQLVIAAGEAVDMRPGGIHVMLSGLAAPLRQGDEVSLTLMFDQGEKLTVPVQVVPIGAGAPDAGHNRGM